MTNEEYAEYIDKVIESSVSTWKWLKSTKQYGKMERMENEFAQISKLIEMWRTSMRFDYLAKQYMKQEELFEMRYQKIGR